MEINFNKIRYYRIKKGMTLDELAKKTELSKGYLSHLETGGRSNPSLGTILKIASVLEEDIGNLF
ncbi:MAG: helix-turn-helix transcriptional regulator [Clostridiales bacterium]|nr:helix-turn-helix transcriptional regulator [Clostridiales bacterium]